MQHLAFEIASTARITLCSVDQCGGVLAWSNGFDDVTHDVSQFFDRHETSPSEHVELVPVGLLPEGCERLAFRFQSATAHAHEER